MKCVIIIDNYDSFTYNLVQAVAILPGQPRIKVFRNDAVTAHSLELHQPTHLIFSPGPCGPNEAGNSNDIIAKWAGRVPILGVCLGHQCIAQVFGARIVRATRCMHGKRSLIYHDGKTIFEKLPNPFPAMRYHSLLVQGGHLQSDFVVSAHTDEQEIMAIRNVRLSIEGVQFHPESFATKEGPLILANFLRQG